MNARLIVTHLAAGLLGLGLGYAALGRVDGVVSRLTGSVDDPVASLRAAVQIEDPQERTRALLHFFSTTDPALAKRLRDEVNKADSGIFLDEIGETLFADWWAKSNPQAAFDNLVDPAWPNRHPWLREVMRIWAKSNPAEAAIAADTLPPNPDRGKVEATRVLVDHWWDKPETTNADALLFLISKLDVRARASAIARLIERSIEVRGIEKTGQFVEAVPVTDDLVFDLRQEVFGRYVQVLVDHDPDEAVQFANKHTGSREWLGLMRHLAFSWGAKDGPAAMRWATSLPDTAPRNNIIVRAWLSFRQANPEAASEWLLAQEPNDVLLTVYRRYLTGIAATDPKKALAIAERTREPEMREQLLAAVGIGWMKSDPKAATAWLDTVELEPGLEDQVRQATATEPQDLAEPAPMG